jgi:predicted enzyme related to lactoylglutathione lyase
MMATPQLVTGVDFVGVPTRNLDAAVEFYGTAVGLPRSVYLKERNYAEFETGNLTLSVFDAEGFGLEHKVNPNAIALHVDDVAQARAALEQRGVRFAGEILDTGVCHMAFFSDPDGNALMLHHRYAPRANGVLNAGTGADAGARGAAVQASTAPSRSPSARWVSCWTPRCRPTNATIIATAMIAAITYTTDRVA